MLSIFLQKADPPKATAAATADAVAPVAIVPRVDTVAALVAEASNTGKTQAQQSAHPTHPMHAAHAAQATQPTPAISSFFPIFSSSPKSVIFILITPSPYNVKPKLKIFKKIIMFQLVTTKKMISFFNLIQIYYINV